MYAACCDKSGWFDVHIPGSRHRLRGVSHQKENISFTTSKQISVDLSINSFLSRFAGLS